MVLSVMTLGSQPGEHSGGAIPEVWAEMPHLVRYLPVTAGRFVGAAIATDLFGKCLRTALRCMSNTWGRHVEEGLPSLHQRGTNSCLGSAAPCNSFGASRDRTPVS